MDYSQTVNNLSAETIAKMKTAIELGHWENGDKLTPKQIESALQAVMLWEAKHQKHSTNEPFVVGANGDLFTGKGESHKLTQPEKIDEKSIIIKNKI